jgi:putative ubiquitin-RnfH superfamily antitoxin RatB of RatAB toxin-antitoxin module
VNGTPLNIEVAYAAPQRVIVKTYRLPAGSRVAQALQLAALDPEFSGVDLAHAPLGIFGIVTRPDHVLEDGDRIEIYRALAADPKTARRARAASAPRPGSPRPR